MEPTFVRAKMKLKVRRNRSKHASANHTMTNVFSSSILLHSLSRTRDLREILSITSQTWGRRTLNKSFNFMRLELGLSAGRDRVGERVVQKEQLNFLE